MQALMYSKLNCPFCIQAENLLNERGIDIDKRMIEDVENKRELLARVPAAKTVPQIFLDDVYIGGYTQLKEYFDNA